MSVRSAMLALGISLLGVLAPVASATGVVAGTVSITFDHPVDTLDNIWFLYDWGDINRAFAVAGTAPAGTTTTLPLSLPSGLPSSPYGVPGFGVVATYGSKAVGIYAGLSPPVALALISSSTSFAAAFPAFGLCSEGDLIAALLGISSCVGLSSTSIVTAFGADAYYRGNPTGASGTGQLAAYTGTGDTATFVKFSDASAGGSISVSFSPALVPEPSAWALLLVGGLALKLALGIRAAMAWRSRPLNPTSSPAPQGLARQSPRSSGR